jgi:hypothetical protein
MDLLLTQIRSEHTAHLKAALLKRTRVDVQDFVSAITSTCINDIQQK